MANALNDSSILSPVIALVSKYSNPYYFNVFTES